MKIKIRLIFVLFTLLSLISYNTNNAFNISVPWNPRRLFIHLTDPRFLSETNPTNTRYRFFDSKSYIPNYQLYYLQKLLYQIEVTGTAIPILCIVNEVEINYNTPHEMEKFTEELRKLLEDYDSNYEKNILFLFFSIEDKLVVMNAGEKAKEAFPEEFLNEISQNIQGHLKSKNYFQGFNDMLIKIYNKGIGYKRTKNEKPTILNDL